MATFPQAPLGVMVEVDLAGTWTDITSYTLQREGTSAPISITRGRPDESGQVNPASMTCQLNNRDGRFSVKNPTGPYYGELTRNTPVRVSVPSQTPYLRLEDGAGVASCPTASALNVAGDLDLRLEVDLDGWTSPGQAIPLASKWGAVSEFSWYLELQTAGQIRFWRSTSGSDAAFADSSLPLPLGRGALRVTYSSSAGTVTFYTAPSISGTWTQLGAAQVISGGGVIFASTASIEAGGLVSIGSGDVPIGVFRGRAGEYVSAGNTGVLTAVSGMPPTPGVPLSSIQAYETWLGRTVDYVLDFMIEAPATWAEFETAAVGTVSGTPLPLATWGNIGTRKMLLGVSACAGASTGSGGATWAAEAAGTNDTHWTNLGNYLIANGYANACLRIGREMNGNWYPWAVTSTNLTDHINGWRHIVTLLRGLSGANFTYMWNPYLGLGNNSSGIADFQSAYPGDSYVDYIGLDVYDGGYPAEGTPFTRTLTDQQATFANQQSQTDGLDSWKTFAASHGKPLAFPEWGLVLWNNSGSIYTGGGDNAWFVQSMASGYIAGSGIHAFWEHYDNGVFDPDGDAGRNGLTVSASRQAFLNAFSGGSSPAVGAGLSGSVYGLQLRSGIGGTLVASPDFTAQTPGAGSFSDGQGNVWTLSGTAQISQRAYRFHGELSNLPVAWDTSGKDVWVPLAAGGLLRRLGQGNAPLNSALKRALLASAGDLAPAAYWPAEDLQGSTEIGSASGGPPMRVSGGTGDGSVTHSGPAFAADSGFLCSGALPTVNGSVWVGYVPRYTSNGSIIVRFLMDIGTAPPNGTRVVRVITTGTITELAFYFTIASGINCVGLAGYNASGTVFDSGAGIVPNLVGSQWWVSLELRPGGSGTVNWSFALLTPGASAGYGLAGSFTGTIGNATACYVNPYGTGFLTDTTIGHISVQSAWESLFSLYKPLNAWQGETAGQRFTRLCGENGLPVSVYGAPDISAPMGPQSPETLTSLLQECEDADRGMIFEPRQALALGYRTYAALVNQAPVVTADYSLAELAGDGGQNPVQPTCDDQYTRNDWTVTRGSGSISGANYRYQLDDGTPMSIAAPPDGVGDYADSTTLNVQYDSQLPDLAGWMVHVGTVDEARWPELPFSMARTAVSGIFWALVDADVGDFLALVNPPAWLPPDQIKQLIPGLTETLGGFFWLIAFTGIPESVYETAIYDDPVYGRADTSGSAVHTGINSAATSMLVDTTTSGAVLWTTSASDFPFDINVGGERMTVTNITGSSSPQTFTVTRHVNGVTKSHSAGEDVRLWFPPIYAIL